MPPTEACTPDSHSTSVQSLHRLRRPASKVKSKATHRTNVRTNATGGRWLRLPVTPENRRGTDLARSLPRCELRGYLAARLQGSTGTSDAGRQVVPSGIARRKHNPCKRPLAPATPFSHAVRC